MADTEQPTTDEDPTSELVGTLSQTARALFSAGSAADTLKRVVDLAVETIDGCDLAGIFIFEEGTVTTPVHTDPLVVDVDAFQHQEREGPCLDALAEDGNAHYAEDLADDARWPHFAPRATSVGIRSALAFRISTSTTVGALNLYARYPQAFGALDRAKGLILASLASLAFSSAQTRDDEARRVDNLQAAMITRSVIGQAQGILMERERVSAEHAFDILRRASQHLNIKLSDVAQALVDSGESPPRGTSRLL